MVAIKNGKRQHSGENDLFILSVYGSNPGTNTITQLYHALETLIEEIVRTSEGRVSRCWLAFGWQDVADIQLYNAHSLHTLIGRWLLLASFLNMGLFRPLFRFIHCWAFYYFDYNKCLTIIRHFRTMLTRRVLTSGVNSATGGSAICKLVNPLGRSLQKWFALLLEMTTGKSGNVSGKK